MIELLLDYGLFLAKTLTLLLAALLLIGALVNLVRHARHGREEHLEVRNVNRRLQDLGDQLRSELLADGDLKRLHKQRKAADKARHKGTTAPRPRLFVLDFHGDLRASAVSELREEITAVLEVAGEGDEVLLRLESEGGIVHGYGLAASQLARLRARKVPLTVAVDKVAASGGYLMACVADRIVAAPFAIVGSIGVVAQLPNFSRLLRKHDVDYELHTAGEYKRTLTVFGENTEEGREKFREELEETHALFKQFVATYRPQLPLESVATGEHWFGTRALELKLIDELRTSDDYLVGRAASSDVYELRYSRPRPLVERLRHNLARLLGDRALPWG